MLEKVLSDTNNILYIATLIFCWMPCTEEHENEEDGILVITSKSVLIGTQGSTITLSGLAANVEVAAYSTAGTPYGAQGNLRPVGCFRLSPTHNTPSNHNIFRCVMKLLIALFCAFRHYGLAISLVCINFAENKKNKL